MKSSQAQQLRATLDVLRAETGRREFGVADINRRQYVRHGYLLALEDVEREFGKLVTIAPPFTDDVGGDVGGEAA